MKNSIITIAIIAFCGVASAQNSTQNGSAIEREVVSCKTNAGAFNGPEKDACIKIAIEKAVLACEVTAASPAMSVERDACIQVAKEDGSK